MKPRDYQLQAIEKIKESFKKGNKNICIALCGGAGKSLVAKLILDMAKEKGSKIGFFSYRTLLIEQIKSYNIPNCTVGTLQKHGKTETELFDLVIIDESWGENSKLRNNIKSKYYITLSGTPTDSYGNALEYDDIIDGVQTIDLINLGFAKPLKIMASSKVDTSNLKLQGGDFSQKESYELMSKSTITKDLVSVYKKHCNDRKTMMFCVNTKHCEDVKKEFIDAGIKCDTVHSKKSNNKEILESFDNQELDLIISVSMLNVGYDNPSVNCIIFARPTKSIPVMMQTIWRGTRINPLKKDDYCLVLDCSEVVERTGFYPMDRLIFTKTKKDTSKICKCGLKMKLINRSINILNDYEYSVISDYKCDCGQIESVNNIKLINISLCEKCQNEFKSVGGLELENSKTNLTFNLTCSCCGHKRVFRDIKLSNDELKELEYNQALENGATWESVKTILKSECKKCGYHHRYTERLIDALKNKCPKPNEAIDKIKTVLRQNKKISALMYI